MPIIHQATQAPDLNAAAEDMPLNIPHRMSSPLTAPSDLIQAAVAEAKKHKWGKAQMGAECRRGPHQLAISSRSNA
jgi:hypothetical protein